jgi:2-methylisocitrate lyase-like PEP mutase family enzyme
MPPAFVIATTAAIARVVRVPLTVDIEGGYSSDPAAVGRLVVELIEAGAVGINLEDGTAGPDLLCAKIERVRKIATEVGVNLYINARIDIYLRGLVAEADRVTETCTRAARYRDAGASGIFAPGAVEPAAIRAIAQATDLPLNLLSWAGLPGAAELAALGVRRLSAGAGIAVGALERTTKLATAFLRDGRREETDGLTSRELNALYGGRR